jgi:hypothetical protein
LKKSLFIIIISLALSCATVQLPGTAGLMSLKNLFRLCESDIEKARRVIIEHDMVKNLSHLQRMDEGGRKYYLLERETITALLGSVTEGVYADFILVNEEGKVVYSKSSTGLFARNIGSLIVNSAGARHGGAGSSPSIFGVPALKEFYDGYYIAVSSKVSGGNTWSGTFILLVDMNKIQDLIGDRSFIIDEKGNYEVTRERMKINTRYDEFGKIDMTRSGDESGVRRFTRSNGSGGAYRFFRYGDRLWVLVSEEETTPSRNLKK